MESMGKHEAKHDLPVSNGWSGSSSRGVIVHCGRCKGYFTPDRAWANRYYDTQARRLAGEENAQALKAIEEDRRYLLSLLAN